MHQFVYSEPGSSARDVIIDGRVVVENGRIATFDADAVLGEANHIFARILERNRDLLDLAKSLAAAVI